MKYLSFALRTLTLFLLAASLAVAQGGTPDPPEEEEVELDVTLEVEEDEEGYDDEDEADSYDYDGEDYEDEEYDYDEYDGETDYDYSPPSPSSSFGAFGGATFELSDLELTSLDPELDATLVFFGGYGVVILNNWMLGGGGTGATLFDMSEEYDRFTFNYGGFLTGYDLSLTQSISTRLTLLTGQGELVMIKKRPDLREENGNELLERFREEDFYFFRPEFSIGIQPLPFLDLRFSTAYLYPLGGDRVDDLQNLTYGIHLMLGFKFPGSPF